MRYGKNDKVRIKSIEWYNSHKNDILGAVPLLPYHFSDEMSKYCGKTARVQEVYQNAYKLNIDHKYFYWTDEMLEPVEKKERTVTLSLEKAKEWYNKGGELRDIALQAYSKDELDDSLPKTWEECINRLENCEYINIDAGIEIISGRIDNHGNVSVYKDCLPSGMGKAILALDQLLICREVYRQGWKPDWTDDTVKHCIFIKSNDTVIRSSIYFRKILSFQTLEIAEKFLENFRDLIEEVKDLI